MKEKFSRRIRKMVFWLRFRSVGSREDKKVEQRNCLHLEPPFERQKEKPARERQFSHKLWETIILPDKNSYVILRIRGKGRFS